MDEPETEMHEPETEIFLDLLDRNARDTGAVIQRVQEILERDRDYWKERAETAERDLMRMERNLLDTLYRGCSFDGR